MSNPLKLFNSLRTTYLKYLDSPFDLRYQDLVDERRLLLDRDGKLYREPLIEPIPPYEGTGQDFSAVADELFGGVWAPDLIEDLKEFISAGLIPPEWEIFQHQKDVFKASAVDGRHVVVTTGTGSGKTECFLLPIASSLIKESQNWSGPSPKPAKWKWWGEAADPGTRRRNQPPIQQRGHEARLPGIRALILYPYNALVEDQLARLRDGFDSAAVRPWLQTNRGGNLFYFGKYVGRTPVSGDRSSSNKESELRAALKAMERDFNAVKGEPAQRFFQNLDGAEM